MSDPHLPAEMLDHIVDHLQDTGDALKSCCLVSKSWIPRARKHLFFDIVFHTAKHLESWKETFPDPSTSPACYAKCLFVGCPEAIMEADADVGGWITSFSHVEYLGLDGQRRFASGSSSLSLLRGFSPIKSLHLVFNNLYILPPRVFTLILSFPLLEDLTVSTPYEISADDDDDGSDGPPTIVQPSSSPTFTGSLNLLVGEEGMKPFTDRLLSLSGGIHFRKLTLMWPHEEDLSSVLALVEACSHTLESLEVSDLRGDLNPPFIDLSKATKLKDVVFQPHLRILEWITMTLQTITPSHRDLREISIRVADYSTTIDDSTGSNVGQIGGESRQCPSLGHVLIQFWESRSIRPKVICTAPCVESYVERFLPEITERGIVDLVEYAWD